MRHAVIDKRIAGINRWLERLQQSYTSGAMENALMDAECARADLEVLRADVWEKVKPGKIELSKNKFISRITNISKIAVLAAAIIMTAVFPISRELPAKTVEEDKTKIVLAEPIKIIYEEPKVLKPVAKVNKTNTNTNIKKNSNLSVAVRENKKNKIVSPSQAEAPVRSEKIEKKKVAYEDLFSLMQTGQKALKNNDSVIKIK